MYESCRFRKTLQNEYLVAEIGVDTAENGPSKVDRMKFVHSRAFRCRCQPVSYESTGVTSKDESIHGGGVAGERERRGAARGEPESSTARPCSDEYIMMIFSILRQNHHTGVNGVAQLTYQCVGYAAPKIGTDAGKH